MTNKEKMNDLSSKVYYDMGNYSQLIIDLVEEGYSLFNDLDTLKENFMSLQYDVDAILEIIDPKRLKEIEALKKLSILLNNEYEK
jgi:hypothetical protein